ncbi:hypothetical protein [Candidatus Pyrohabitans sp.]
MGGIPEEVARTVCSLCTSAKLESIKKVDAEALKGEIEERQGRGFTGVLRLSFKEGEKLVSLYFLFLCGTRVLVMKEVVSPSGDSTFYAVSEAGLREGALEILLVEETAIKRVAEKLPEAASVEVEAPSRAASPEIPDEILKFKQRIMADAEKAARKALDELRPRASVEHLRKKELSGEKCREILDIIERELRTTFGEVKGRNLLRLRLTEMRFNEEEASCAAVVELINYFRNTALKNKLGREEADRVADRMLWRLAKIAEE